MRSQDTIDVRPVTFPFWMVQEIALDLAEKERLEVVERINLLQLANYKSLVSLWEKSSNHKSLQLELHRRENLLLKSQLKMKKANNRKDQTFLWLLRLIGSFWGGYLLGHL